MTEKRKGGESERAGENEIKVKEGKDRKRKRRTSRKGKEGKGERRTGVRRRIRK